MLKLTKLRIRLGDDTTGFTDALCYPWVVAGDPGSVQEVVNLGAGIHCFGSRLPPIISLPHDTLQQAIGFLLRRREVTAVQTISGKVDKDLDCLRGIRARDTLYLLAQIEEFGCQRRRGLRIAS